MHQLQKLHKIITRVDNTKAVLNYNGHSNGYLIILFFVINQCTGVNDEAMLLVIAKKRLSEFLKRTLKNKIQ